MARAYLEEIVQEQSDTDPKIVEGVLRWIALVGPLNRENDATVQLVAERTATDSTTLLALLAKLVHRRALIERGARRRLAEVKPDVLRDRLLLDWLTTHVGFGDQPLRPSADAKRLTAEVVEAMRTGNATGTHRATLVSLARSELLLRLAGQTVELLGPVFDALRQTVDAISASHRIELVETLEPIAPFRPRLIIELIQTFLANPCPVERHETRFGTREVGPDDVALTLSWLASHAALGARDEEVPLVLEILCSLVIIESEIQSRRGGLRNDGKHALRQVQSALEGGPQFLSSYDGAARAIAQRILDAIATSAPAESQRALVEALVLPIMSIERMQSWHSNTAFHWRRYVIDPGDETWTTRAEALERIKALLQNNTMPTSSRVLLWKLVVEAHASANRSQPPGKPPAH